MFIQVVIAFVLVELSSWWRCYVRLFILVSAWRNMVRQDMKRMRLSRMKIYLIESDYSILYWRCLCLERIRRVSANLWLVLDIWHGWRQRLSMMPLWKCFPVWKVLIWRIELPAVYKCCLIWAFLWFIDFIIHLVQSRWICSCVCLCLALIWMIPTRLLILC